MNTQKFIRELFKNGSPSQEIEDLAIEHGIAEYVEVESSCGEFCECEDGHDFEQGAADCFRFKEKSLNDYTIKELIEAGWRVDISKHSKADREEAIDALFELHETRDHVTYQYNDANWVQSGENPNIAVFFKKSLLNFDDVTKTELTETHLTVWFKPHDFAIAAELSVDQRELDDNVEIVTDLGDFEQADLMRFMSEALEYELEKQKEEQENAY